MTQTAFTKRRGLYTGQEIRLLREHRRQGAIFVAELLGRSPDSVRQQARRLRISLRRRGERRGLVLGQPRGVSLRRALREDLVSGRCDPELVARRMALEREAALCPACGSRPVEVRTTGYCLRCHEVKLTEGHAAAAADAKTHREYNAAKQRAKREHDRAGIVTPLAAKRRENRARNGKGSEASIRAIAARLG